MISELKKKYTDAVNEAVLKISRQNAIDDVFVIEGEKPPKKEMGDLAFPFFSLSKVFRMSPNAIAQKVKDALSVDEGERCEVMGGYVNFFYNKQAIYDSLIKTAMNSDWGKNESLKGERIMVEFSCPNTNKPLHLGHMRNDALGESIASLLKESGAEVQKVNLVNDRGVHICKSMLAYEKFNTGDTPMNTGIKGDHFVGNYYVKFNAWQTEEQNKPNRNENEPLPDRLAQELLEKWEMGDKKTIELWERMRSWVLDGLEETYKRTLVSFDRYYYESQLYKRGKDEVLKGLEKGVFYKSDDGAVKADLSPIGADEKVLLRKDGTSIYITQDIGTAIQRHNDWNYTSCIYVVGNEQIYHFKALFYILSLLGFDWSKKLYHLSYGMVNLPDGRMKSREGTVVDADNLLDELRAMSLSVIKQERGHSEQEANDIAEKVALGALNYFLLSPTPSRDMIFDSKKSLEFQGNTGPYLQYMGARVSGILRSAGSKEIKNTNNVSLNENEQTLVALLDEYPEIVEKAAKEKNPSILAAYLYDISSSFSKWYHDDNILNAAEDVKTMRLNICIIFKKVLEKGFNILHIPFLEKM
ncbi:MAG: arginine--tRNA ligase [Sphaerochaetaceae bacterium]|nr:arginine--tRNA ligase [Sphaerochaetaceae bacterium]